jgi:hypothetical protein
VGDRPPVFPFTEPNDFDGICPSLIDDALRSQDLQPPAPLPRLVQLLLQSRPSGNNLGQDKQVACPPDYLLIIPQRIYTIQHPLVELPDVQHPFSFACRSIWLSLKALRHQGDYFRLVF